MEYWKQPLIELHQKLYVLLNEKNQEILNAFDTTNKTNNMSRIQNRTKDVDGFLAAIKEVEPNSDFMPGFKKRFEEIEAEIESIKL